jgi:predicted ArsR family transcriptional regulator
MGTIADVGRREDILRFLRSNGEASLAELAEHAELSKQGVLRHVEALEAAGLIERIAVAHAGPGRPEHHYRAIPAAADLVPGAHRKLATELLDFMPNDELEAFFKMRAERLEKQYAERLAGLDFEGRVRELARLATEAGHMAEVVTMPDGNLGIRHCNCPIQDAAARSGHPCQQEQVMYQRLLGKQIERMTWMTQNDSNCTYEIKSKKG